MIDVDTKTWVGTGRAARTVGIHPNTLRWYEAAGYLPALPRTPSGYRKFSQEMVQLARIVKMSQPVLRIHGDIRRQAQRVLECCRSEDVSAAQEENRRLGAMLERELGLALRALEVVEGWRRKQPPRPLHGGSPAREPLRRMIYLGEAAAATGLTRDRIIAWERNGLCSLPRSPANGYRIVGSEEIDRLLVIRSCRTAGYSVTAIKRLLDAADGDIEEGTDTLRRVADTPGGEEGMLFPVFPTDTLPATLEELIGISARLADEIDVLSRLSEGTR